MTLVVAAVVIFALGFVFGFAIAEELSRD